MLAYIISTANQAPNNHLGWWIFLVILMAFVAVAALLFTGFVAAVIGSLGGTGHWIVFGAVVSCLSIWGLIRSIKRFRKERRKKGLS
jgi:membrane protein implicated in regulation of membrane protease activity